MKEKILKEVFSLYRGLFLSVFISNVLVAQTFNNEVKSDINFKIQNLEIVANGRFERIDANIVFEKEFPEKTKFAASIDVNSIKTGIKLRDKHLKGKMYFDMATYPKILLSLVQNKDLGNNHFEGIFLIKIKSVEKLMTIPYNMKTVNGKLSFEGQFKINRRDFNIGSRSWTLADTAKVNVQFVLQK